MNQHLVEWQAPEHIYTEKNKDWYWIVGIITISIVLISIILGDLIFGILILVASITLSLHASKPPRIINIEINNTGIQTGNLIYPFDELTSFWVETKDLYPRLILKSKKVLMPFVSILLADADPDEITRALLLHLPEEHHTESLLEKIMIRLGF